MRDDMVRDVHDTEEVQGDIFLDDGEVISKTNVMKPSPVVTATRSEDTSAESVGYRVKDAKSRKNESPLPSLLPPHDVISSNDDIHIPNDVDEYNEDSQDDDDDDDDDKENDNDLRDQINDGDFAIPPTELAHQRECDNGSERLLSSSPISTNDANGGNARNRRWSAIAKRSSSPPSRFVAHSVPVRPPTLPTRSSTQKSVVSGRSDAAIAPSPSGSYRSRKPREGNRVVRHSVPSSMGPSSSQQSVVSGWSDVAVVPPSSPGNHARHRHYGQRRVDGPQNDDNEEHGRTTQGLSHRPGPAGVLREHQKYSNRHQPHARRRNKERREEKRPWGIHRSNSNVSNVSFATLGGRSNFALDGLADVSPQRVWGGKTRFVPYFTEKSTPAQ